MRSLFLLIFCLFAFPCQAKEIHCLVRGVPCYIKSETIILREGPSRDSKILHSIQPKKNTERYYYLKYKVPFEGGLGLFESVDETLDLVDGTYVFRKNKGWMPLDEAFHDVDYEKSRTILQNGKDEFVLLLIYKPNTRVIYINAKDFSAWFPLEEATYFFAKEK